MDAGLRWAFREDHFVLRAHAHQKLLLEALTTDELGSAGGACELLEDYPDREQGHTQLLLGVSSQAVTIHIVANVAGFESDASEPIAVVTVDRPEPPEWLDERTRGPS